MLYISEKQATTLTKKAENKLMNYAILCGWGWKRYKLPYCRITQKYATILNSHAFDPGEQEMEDSAEIPKAQGEDTPSEETAQEPVRETTGESPEVGKEDPNNSLEEEEIDPENGPFICKFCKVSYINGCIAFFTWKKSFSGL